jgi:hypothetical protein
MLLDLALLPEVFENSAYSGDGACGHCLRALKPVLLEEAVVRDLRGGTWSSFVCQRSEQWHPAGKEVLEALIKRKRLCFIPKAPQLTEPVESREWCYEALASHNEANLHGILCGNNTKEEFSDEPLVQAAEVIHESPWYTGRTGSVRLRRQSEDYLKHLSVILRWCRSAIFIDPHLDPSRDGYKEFHQLLDAACVRELKPRFELHRCRPFEGAGPDRHPLSFGQTEELFKPLSDKLKKAKLKAEVFIWEDFHDRYLITDLLGICLPNGFDISADPNERTTWARLSWQDRDDVYREFDPNAHRHQLVFRFDIGHTG